jgi:hypothetical protein
VLSPTESPTERNVQTEFGFIVLIRIEIFVICSLYTCTLTDNHGNEKSCASIQPYVYFRWLLFLAPRVCLPRGEIDHILHSYMC